MPKALFLDIWKDFTPMDDDLHPDRKTTQRAAKRIAKAIKRHQRQQSNTEY
ncbi:hypothetical protein [Pseudoalteromonas luteoviolacea]|uniref:hypothetical protein n=1 Tax=Pseudoalteromonas luteoviolacea TaxID=43657 RepID=UPI000A99B3BC|nr:hypothetical protein [Pseudoalteromonas luteoviolacea]